MLKAGNTQRLTVKRISEHGVYLADDEGEEVLLPNRYVSLSDRPGKEMTVFVYHDSEDRLVATTEEPYAEVGQAACLEAVGTNAHGAFLDWGLTGKDLFLPRRNQKGTVETGGRYVVYIYRDSVSGRAVATMQLGGFINNHEISLKPRQQVTALVALKTPRGFRAVIDNRHWGMLYDNQLFRPVHVGETYTAYVRKIAEDGRIDLALQPEGFGAVKEGADKLLALLEYRGGTLDLGDDSTPEAIYEGTRMSKKVFKRALGSLLSRGLVTAEPERIRLKK